MNLKKNEQEIQDTLAKIWEEVRHGNPSSLLFYTHWVNLFSRIIVKLTPSSILDCGSGTGFLLRHLSKITTANLIGLDISSTMLMYTKRNLKNQTINLIQADGAHLPFKSKSISLVTCMGSLHHMPDMKTVILEIRHIIRSSGNLLLSETHNNLFLEPFRMLLKQSSKFSRTHQALSEKKLSIILKNHGFKIIIKRYFGYVAFAILGFPDIIPLAQNIPAWMTALLIKIDGLISKIPIINRISWHIFFHACLES